MKKALIILLFFALIQTSCFGQYQLGVKGGYNYFQLFNKNFSNTCVKGSIDPNKNSNVIGISFRDNTILQPVFVYDLAYRSYSFWVKSDSYLHGAGSNIDLHYNIEYLFFTIANEFSFGQKLKFLIKPGIYYQRLISTSVTGTKVVFESGVKTITDSLNNEPDESFSKDGFGAKVGIGLAIPLSKHFNILFENNYSLLLGTSSDLFEASVSVFNASFELAILYKFDSFHFKSKPKKE